MKNKFIAGIFTILLLAFTFTNTGTVFEKEYTSSAMEMPEDMSIHASTFVYDFGNERKYGLTLNGCIPYEAIMGLDIRTSGKKAYISTYTNKPEVEMFTGTIEIRDGITFKLLKTYSGLEMADEVIFTPNEKGLYKISMELTKAGCTGYIYFDGENVFTCRCSSDSSKIAKDAWNKLMKGADPKDYLSNKDITYPTSGRYDRPVHVKEWEDLSDQVIKKAGAEDWSDEMKAYILSAYIAKHYAYDNYRVNQLKMDSRADEAGAYEDQYYMYYNHVGVCWDFANALIIMLRHQGIPATSVEDDHHTAVAAWIRDQWICIDITGLIGHDCYTKDTDEDNWTTLVYGSFQSYFGVYVNWPTRRDTEVWTYKNSTTPR